MWGERGLVRGGGIGEVFGWGDWILEGFWRGFWFLVGNWVVKRLWGLDFWGGRGFLCVGSPRS